MPILLRDITKKQRWAFALDDPHDENKNYLHVEVRCKCGQRVNMACVLALEDYAECCLDDGPDPKCDAGWLDKELEEWC